MEDSAQRDIKEFERLSTDRSTFEAHWQEIAERMYPQYSNTFTANTYNNDNPGEKKTSELYDSTAILALSRFAAIVDSLLTPRNQTWHRLKVDNLYLAKDRDVVLYFDEVNRILFKQRYSPKANFSSQNQQIFKGLGAFGTGGMFIDELFGSRGLRYKSVPLGELFFIENHQGQVVGVYRQFQLTAMQAVEIAAWQGGLPEKIKIDAKAHPQTFYKFLHIVRPRENYDPNKLDAKNMPWESRVVSIEGQKVVTEGGYSSFPYAVTRYEQAAGEKYGRSPAMEVLPATKTLNEEKKTVLKQGHRTVDPILLAHDDGVMDNFSMRPGAMNFGGVTADGRPLVHTLPIGNVMVGKELMDDERSAINDAFLVNLFQILVETPTMTATEVMEKSREKGILLAPTIGRQTSEYLGPLIEREVDVLSRQGLLPKMPDVLMEARGEYTIEYDSPLSRAQRAEEASGLMRTVEQALEIANVTQNQEVLDYFNWDVIIPEMSSIQGVPAKWLKSVEQIQQIRMGRAKQMQEQQAMQAAPGAAAMIKAQAVAKEKS